MKYLKTTLLAFTLVMFASLAFGQGQVSFLYYDHGDGNPPPLRTQCTTGDSLPDGTLITIYWDNNHNGPDDSDVPPELGTGYGQANFTTFPMNGLQSGLGSGYFAADFDFVVSQLPGSATVPGDTALYYLEISTSTLCWRSDDVVLQAGAQEWDMTAADWTCTTGAPCRMDTTPPPAAPTNVVASDGGCEVVHVTWQHDGENVNGFNIYADGVRVGGAQSEEREVYILILSTAVKSYTVKAFNVGGESPASNADNGNSYLLKFAAGAAGNLEGDSLRGSTHTIQFVRPDDGCLSRAWLYLYDATHHSLRGLLATCDSCLQTEFTLPDSALDINCRLVLKDSSYYSHTTYSDTSASVFRLIPPDAVDVRNALRPDRFDMTQNYPNPFNPDTRIMFNVPQQAEVRLNVYNVMGQLVRTLASGTFTMGQHEVTWDGRDQNGMSVSAGIYLYRLEGQGVNVTKKMLLMK
jgi:hypothetical protein